MHLLDNYITIETLSSTMQYLCSAAWLGVLVFHASSMILGRLLVFVD